MEGSDLTLARRRDRFHNYYWPRQSAEQSESVMRKLRPVVFAVIAVMGCGSARGGAVDVVEIARSFPDGGGYEWKGTGVPEDVRFGNVTILAKGKATYCSGFTFAVAMKAAEDRGLLRGKTEEQIRRFQREWYGSTPESAEKQCAFALEKLGIGGEVKAADARAGDFLQLWRTNKSGHSAVFLEWVIEDGKRVGVKYRSTQKSTGGIGDRVEYFDGVAGRGGKVDRKRMWFGRLGEGRSGK